ncbi:MAG: hypothetical protein WD960_02560 [Gemmatimonadota bacterium]
MPDATQLRSALSHLAGESDPAHGLRALYHRAVHNEELIPQADEAARDLLLRDPENHVARAYLAALDALRAQHGPWPPSRLRHLRNAREGLDSLIEEAPTKAELRYLRLATEVHVPRFLGREETLREDRRALEGLLASGRHSLSRGTELLIREFLGSL